jgi:sugar/nucleoside kinase (ribokinase family)
MNTASTALEDAYFDISWPKDRRFQVIGFGLNAVDWVCLLPHFPSHNTKMQLEEMQQLGGGQVATASALCSRYGLRVRYVGRVGDDDIGRFSLASLSEEDMDISHVEIVPGAYSQFAIILVDRPTGERTILWDRDHKLDYRPSELQKEWLTEGQILHLDGHDQAACIRAAQWAHEAGMQVSLDVDKIQPGVEDLLKLADFAIPTVEFVRRFTGRNDWKEALLKVDEITPYFTGVTLGKDGCAAVWNRRIFEIKGFPVNALDTTGAGDVFHGAFIYAVLHNWNVHRCLRFANAAGALSCTRLGARGGLPSLEGTRALLDGRNVQE